jgi:hypothetical protein
LPVNRAKNIDDVEPVEAIFNDAERVEAVFNDGIGYDPAKRMCSDMMGLRWWLELLHEFVLAGLRNNYVNQFQARGGFRQHAS